MCHKLQPSSHDGHGLNTDVRQNSNISTSEIASNDEAPACDSAMPESRLEKSSTGNSKCIKIPRLGESGAVSDESQNTGRAASLRSSSEPINAGSPEQTPGRERPTVRHQNQNQEPLQDQEPRCEVARSAGYDPTGERAEACGAVAQVVCEYCGPMCAACAEETFCYYGEHKLTQLPEDGPLPPSRTRRRPVNEVVYVELKCPKCKCVRLALPKKHHPQRIRKCPVCRMKVPAEYLAHGFTRRRLPYYEVFTTEKELPEGLESKRRVPWDRRPKWCEED